jgi:L-ascorbate metabolism protein UlaG (beta-lactamase superfamily)
MRALPGHRAGALQHDRPQEAVELCRLVRPRTAIPVHYEGWTHFRQGRTAIEQEFEQAPADIGRGLQWLPIGAGVSIAG